MDPDATWLQLLNALSRGEVVDAINYAEALAIWIANGGFVPDHLTFALREVS